MIAHLKNQKPQARFARSAVTRQAGIEWRLSQVHFGPPAEVAWAGNLQPALTAELSVLQCAIEVAWASNKDQSTLHPPLLIAYQSRLSLRATLTCPYRAIASRLVVDHWMI